jgi:hypothetical protein
MRQRVRESHWSGDVSPSRSLSATRRSAGSREVGA